MLVPGSYDPVHNGHLEVIERAAQLFDRVVLAAVHNPSKEGRFHDGGASGHAPRIDRPPFQRHG